MREMSIAHVRAHPSQATFHSRLILQSCKKKVGQISQTRDGRPRGFQKGKDAFPETGTRMRSAILGN